MDRADVIARLKRFAKSMRLADGQTAICFDSVDAAVIDAAIDLLTPEPVTEEGLRAEGFTRRDTPFGDNWVLRVQDDLDITFFQRRWVLAEFEGGEHDLHIESMQQLREVIKALRGKTNESEASE